MAISHLLRGGERVEFMSTGNNSAVKAKHYSLTETVCLAKEQVFRANTRGSI